MLGGIPVFYHISYNSYNDIVNFKQTGKPDMIIQN